MIRRRIVLAYWVVALGFFTPGAVHAYIDPATTTYLIQIFTALVVTIGVSLSIFLYRFRIITAKVRYGIYGLIYRLRRGGGPRGGDDRPPQDGGVGVDGEGGAAARGVAGADDGYVFPDYAIPGGTGPLTEEDMAALGEPADLLIITQKGQGTEMPWKRDYPGRLKAALPVSLAVSLSFILIGCLDLTMQNAGDMPFRPGAIVPALLVVTGVCFAVLLFILPVFRGTAYQILVSLALAVLIAGYIQGNYMNGILGELNGEPIDWGLYLPQTIGSVLMWAAAIVCVFLLLRFAKGAWRRVVLFAPLLLLVIQAAGLAAAFEDYRQNQNTSFWVQTEDMLTIDGLHDVASERNAIIFVIDRLDEEFLDMIDDNHPGFFEALDGFTRFDDNISYAGSTFPSVTEMLTGSIYEWDRSAADYFEYAWEHADFMRALKEGGADIRLYMDRGYAYGDGEELRGIASNLFKGDLGFDRQIVLVKLLKLSGFRYSPMPAKHVFWIAPNEFGDAVRLTDETAFFLVNDFAFHANIEKNGLRVMDAKLGFVYYHLQGAHGPFNMDEDMNWVEEEKTKNYTPQRVRQATGCFKIVFDYLDRMKALGLYEDATIIITADHGDFYADELTRPALTALFVKPAGSAGTPLAYNHAPVCPAQIPGTVMEGLFGDAEGFAPGYMEVKEGPDAVREYNVNLYEYEIKGDGRNFEDWRHIGTYPDTWK